MITAFRLYRVTRWTLNGWRFIITLIPTEPRLENIFLKGETFLDRLDLEVGGTGKKWKQKLVLYKESRIQISNAETESKIEEIPDK
jgi:hypothetical protein